MKYFFQRSLQQPHGKKEETSNTSTVLFYPLSKLQALSLSVYSLLSTFNLLPKKLKKKTQHPMEKHQYCYVLIFSIVVSLGLVSFASCIAAEFKKTKIKDINLDGKLCYLPGSHAYDHGIVALICLFIAQIIGNLVICRIFCSREKRSSCKAKKPTIVTTLLLISWMSFGIAVVLMSASTSMSRRQPYGKGWLEGECYIVKDGVYIGSSVLVLLAIASMLGSAIITIRKSQAEHTHK